MNQKSLSKLKQEGLICVNNIDHALDKLREVISKELNYTKASDINIDLVKKLREIEKEIRECL